MQTNQHTPGPWRNTSIGGSVYDADNSVIAWLQSLPARKENARLIAAAPDLLEAVAQAEAFIHDFENGLMHDAANLLEQLRAAIAKARGEGNGQ